MSEQHHTEASGSPAAFRRSSYCGDMSCVEVAASPEGEILVRDTKDSENGPVLRFTEQEWIDFVRGVTAGEFTPAALTSNS